jgi:purine-binding chemotaxis protein CheW
VTVGTGAQIVTFRLGEDLFAADINDVERVLRYAEPTPVPNVPDWVKGVIEYRSRVVPVVDLRERFELSGSAVNGATRLMVLSADGEWVAAIVDAVLEVVPLGASLAEPPALFRGLAAEFLRGILRRGERLVIVLDIPRLLSTHDRLSFDIDGASLGSISIGTGAADVAGEDGDEARPAVVSAAVEPDPSDTSSLPAAAPDAIGGPLDPLAGSEPVDGGPLRLVGTNEEAPRPDESILEASTDAAPIELPSDDDGTKGRGDG